MVKCASRIELSVSAHSRKKFATNLGGDWYRLGTTTTGRIMMKNTFIWNHLSDQFYARNDAGLGSFCFSPGGLTNIFMPVR